MSNFKKTIRTILLFVLVISVFSTAIMEVFFYGENYYYQDARERDELSGSLDFFVCGSSHAMRAFKPDILDEELGVNSYNISSSNITMQGRYEMLNLEIERNPIDTVVLDVSYNSLTRSRDEYGFEGDFYILSKLDVWHRIPYFFESIKPSEYISIYYEYLNKGFDCLNKAVHGTWTDQNDKIYKGYVYYESLQYEGDEIAQLTSDYASVYHTKAYSEEINETDLEDLENVLNLCAQNNINVILVSIPLSRTFISTYDNLDVFKGWYEDIAKEYGVQFYDFNLYKGYAETFSDELDFHDVHHLNDIGASKFSEIFANVYNKAKNGEDTSTLFYDSYDKLDTQIFDFNFN